MEITTVLGIGLGVAMDAFAVAVTNGMAVRRLSIAFAIKQASVFALFQALMPFLGWLAGIAVSEKIELYGHWAAFVILCLLGIKMCLEAHRKKKKHAADSFILEREPPMRVLIALAIATSIDALAVGVTFACSDVEGFNELMLNVLIIGAITLILCIAGGFLGRRSGDIFKGKSEIIGGVVLFIMALKTLAESIY
ncbi:MAG: manganese efflux pump [Clostridiales bacterium]|jgi:putative Mn2+ efflux pump MntP|nr:manganese efflux pump [Clostridiales bacterium]